MKPHTLLQSFAFALITLGLIGCSGSQNTASLSTMDAPMIMDGEPAEWDLESTRLLMDDRFHIYASKNPTGDVLYVYINVASPFLQEAVKRSGLTLYLSSDKENPEARGVTYPSGTFNLLRDNPSFYDDFLRDKEWLGKKENIDDLQASEPRIYETATLKEKYDKKSTQDAANVPLSMVQSEGTVIGLDTVQTGLSLEWKIPLDRTAPFQVESGELVMGIAIEPPMFVFRSDEDITQPSSRVGQGQGYGRGGYGYGGYGQGRYGRRPQRRTPTDQGHAIRRSLGETEVWFTLK
ncbi:MAG TPA: hypothetical protein DEF03_03960 [Bacteroidetes bacterium]|nr:hypothetical protein [Bacteroidota bacterium]